MELHTTLEQSRLLASKGYKEDTFFFYAKRIATGTWHLCIPIQAEDTETKKFCDATAYYSYTANTTFSQYEFEEDTLPAPTVAEIYMPCGFYIQRVKIAVGYEDKKMEIPIHKSVFYVFDNNKRIFVENLSGGRIKQKAFETEIDARIEVYTHFSKKEANNA